MICSEKYVRFSKLLLFYIVLGFAILYMSKDVYADTGMDYLIKHNFNAKIYETNAYSAGGNGVSLTNKGINIKGWEYDKSKYLQVDILVDANPDEVHIVEVKLAPIFYAVNDLSSPPAGYSKVENIKTPDIYCNNNQTLYKPKTGTGTFKFYLQPNSTRASIQLELRYDTVLWDKFENSYLTKPNVSPVEISMYHEKSVIDTTLEENASRLKVATVQSGRGMMGSGFVYYKRSYNSGDGYWDPMVNFYQYRDKIARIMLFVNESERFYIDKYYEKLKVEVNVPFCIENGRRYYADYDLDSITFHGIKASDYKKVNIEYASESKIVFSMNGYYSGDDMPICLNFTCPSNLYSYSSLGYFTFVDGSTSVSVINNHGDTQEIGTQNMGLLYYAYIKKELVIASGGTVTNVLRTYYPEDAVTKLSAFYISNEETGDSTPKTITLTFNKKHLVTAIALPVDTATSAYNVTYTLRDENGDTVFLDSKGNRVSSGISSWNISIKNDAYNSKSIDNTSTIFKTTQLPEQHRKYYLASVKYTIKTVLAVSHMYDASDVAHSIYGAGTVYGRLSKTAYTGEVINNSLFIQSPSSSSIANINATFSGKVVSSQSASYGITNVTYSRDTIYAGESVWINGEVFVDEIYYKADCTWIRDVKLAVVLPEGVSVDTSSIKIRTSKTKETINIEKIEERTIGDKKICEINLDRNACVGYYNLNLDGLPQGTTMVFDIRLKTSSAMDTTSLFTSDILFAGANNQENDIDYCHKGYATVDKYDLNENGLKSDYVGCVLLSHAKVCTINGDVPKLNITDDVEVTDKDGKIRDDDILENATDVVNYNLTVKSENDGSASSFEYYVPIPNTNSTDDEYLLYGNQEDAFNLKLREKVYVSGDDIYDIQYTSESDLTYKDARKNAKWYTAEDLVAQGKSFEDVTMVKIVVKSDQILEKGMDTTITLKLAYAGTDFKNDKDKYLMWNSCGYYDFDDGVKCVSGHYPTDGVRVDVKPNENVPTRFVLEKMDKIYYMYDVIGYENISLSEPITFYIEHAEDKDVTFTVSTSKEHSDTSEYIDAYKLELKDEAGNIISSVNNQYTIKTNKKYVLKAKRLIFGTNSQIKMDVFMYGIIDNMIINEHIILKRVSAFQQH